jgi:hypothetical protein
MDAGLIASAFDEFNTTKGNGPTAEDGSILTGHMYHNAYSRVLATRYPASLLEVGVTRGRSIAAWKKLLPEAQIAGIDKVDPLTIDDGYVGLFPRAPDTSTWDLFVGDATRRSFTSTIPNTYDIIVDDTNATWEERCAIFDNLIDKCNNIYVLESIQGARHERFIRNMVKAKGYTNILTFDSRLQGMIAYSGGPEESFTYMMMVVIKDDSVQLAG